MFTGIVQGVGTVRAIEPRGGDVTIVFDTGDVALDGVEPGGSIAVNGVCLTATTRDRSSFTADVSRETLSLTTLGRWREGTRVNVEKALLAGQALGGHYVTGHVDGVAEVVSRHDDARSVRMAFRVPRDLARYVARKGSICIDGVSLTVNGVDDDRFDVNLVPHTLDVTTLGALEPGSRVNLEVDIIARYVERMSGATGAGHPPPTATPC
jgi:riboflavin synthase